MANDASADCELPDHHDQAASCTPGTGTPRSGSQFVNHVLAGLSGPRLPARVIALPFEALVPPDWGLSF